MTGRGDKTPGYPRTRVRPLKYAVVEREPRYLLARLPEGVTSTKDIVDRYVTGTRLRLREVRESDGAVVRKLGHKVRLTEGPDEIACTNFYLDDEEWAVLAALPARTLRKKRHMVLRMAGSLRSTSTRTARSSRRSMTVTNRPTVFRTGSTS